MFPWGRFYNRHKDEYRSALPAINVLDDEELVHDNKGGPGQQNVHKWHKTMVSFPFGESPDKPMRA